MISEILNKPAPTQSKAPASGISPGPVRRPEKGFFSLLGEVLRHGGPGYLQFAITNVCNAKCDFCGFAVDRFDPKQRRSVSLQEAKDVIDICLRNHIGYLLFVGGEPLVHRDLRAMVRYAAERGILLADSKFELGLDENGTVVLGDELFTPDSSRFWSAEAYAPGGAQPSLDKQPVRDWTEATGWDKSYPGPELPADVVAFTRERYVQAFERLTEIPFDDYLADPEVVLK